MNTKTMNEIFGYALFGIGVSKIILVILVLMQVNMNMNAIFNGGYFNNYDYSTFSAIIGLLQLILAAGSIIMIFVNIIKQPEVIPGYVLGLGALLIELIAPSILMIFAIFVECGMYMKAGAKIRNKNIFTKEEHKTSKKKTKNTEWFYGGQNEQSTKENNQEQKRKAKLEKELYEWKQLLDSGEIDEETYKQETDRLIEKERRRSERRKK